MVRDYGSQKLFYRDPEDTLDGVEHHFVLSRLLNVSCKSSMRLFYFLDITKCLPRRCGCYDQLICQAILHSVMVGCACILHIEGHNDITIHAVGCDERGCELVRPFHIDLVVVKAHI
jgi:hypothetical protein